MSRLELRFYLDENMDPEIARQLRKLGINALAAQDVGLLGVSDDVQLRYAAARERVLCTKDSGFANPSNWHVVHDGIAYFPDSSSGIGYAVHVLARLHQNETPKSMKNSLRYL